MNLRPSLIKLEVFKRRMLIVFLGLIAISFFSKNVLSDYSSDQLVEIIELVENGEEESESEREESKEEIDDYTKAIFQFVAQTKTEIEHFWDSEIIWNTRYSEVLTPPPDCI